MVKLVDSGDSKSPAARRAGSSPAPGTTDKAALFFEQRGFFFLCHFQTLTERTRFPLSEAQWLAFQAALAQPVNAIPKLKNLLPESGLLG